MITVLTITDKLIRKEKPTVDASIAALTAELARETALLPGAPLPGTPLGLVQRLLQLYRGARPFFALIVKLPIFPKAWLPVVEEFLRVLDALGAPEVAGRFKAGRDL